MFFADSWPVENLTLDRQGVPEYRNVFAAPGKISSFPWTLRQE